jgi:predicted secreted protein
VPAATVANLASGSDTETYNTIAEVNDIVGPNMSMGTIDTTSHDSASGWREFVSTLKDGGQVTFKCNFLPVSTTQNHILGLIRDFKHGLLRKMKIIFTDTALTPWLFTAYFINVTPGAPVEGKLSLDVAVKLSGLVTLA